MAIFAVARESRNLQNPKENADPSPHGGSG